MLGTTRLDEKWWIWPAYLEVHHLIGINSGFASLRYKKCFITEECNALRSYRRYAY